MTIDHATLPVPTSFAPLATSPMPGATAGSERKGSMTLPFTVAEGTKSRSNTAPGNNTTTLPEVATVADGTPRATVQEEAMAAPTAAAAEPAAQDPEASAATVKGHKRKPSFFQTLFHRTPSSAQPRKTEAQDRQPQVSPPLTTIAEDAEAGPHAATTPLLTRQDTGEDADAMERSVDAQTVFEVEVVEASTTDSEQAGAAAEKARKGRRKAGLFGCMAKPRTDP